MVVEVAVWLKFLCKLLYWYKHTHTRSLREAIGNVKASYIFFKQIHPPLSERLIDLDRLYVFFFFFFIIIIIINSILFYKHAYCVFERRGDFRINDCKIKIIIEKRICLEEKIKIENKCVHPCLIHLVHFQIGGAYDLTSIYTNQAFVYISEWEVGKAWPIYFWKKINSFITYCSLTVITDWSQKLSIDNNRLVE
jgi:hypothetical protein